MSSSHISRKARMSLSTSATVSTLRPAFRGLPVFLPVEHPFLQPMQDCTLVVACQRRGGAQRHEVAQEHKARITDTRGHRHVRTTARSYWCVGTTLLSEAR